MQPAQQVIQTRFSNNYRSTARLITPHSIVVAGDAIVTGPFLALPSDLGGGGDGKDSANRRRLTRHSTHQLRITYGPGKAKIAFICSTLSLFGESTDSPDLLTLARMGSRTWAVEFEDMRALETTLATGEFTAYASPEAKEESDLRGAALQEKSRSYERKLPLSMTLEYHDYTGGYTHVTRTRSKFSLFVGRVSLQEALATPNARNTYL